MLKKNLALVTLAVFAAGCGVEMRSYVMTKPRVGLDQTGNGGCVVGKCPPAPAPTETTRKVYVLEITRPVPESEVRKIEVNAVNAIADAETPPASNIESAPSAPASTDNTQPAPAPQPAIPVVGELPGAAPTPSEPAVTAPAPASNGGTLEQGQTYTVQKDDTLQKISKKVYGTYGKWYKIYEANKRKIKNPNILRSGTVLVIPALK